MKLSIPIRLVIADDHEIYRDGLKIMLRKQPDIEVIGEASNGKELIELTHKLEPDMIMTDIVMPVMDGIDATRQLTQSFPAVNIIALSMFDQENLIIDMLEAGAKGYLLKNADKMEITEAIKSVFKNIPYYCRSTSVKLARMIGQSKFNPYKKIDKPSFTEKEIRIIQYICQEFTNKEIGRELYLSDRTVEGYRVKILGKMNVKSTAGIVIYAIKNGIYKV
jgi:two-component system, NarL family, response regulator NreC